MIIVLLLGVVQGIAEFLPISSSGHLIVAQYLFGVHSRGIAIEVALHMGTLLAVIMVYRRDIWQWVVAVHSPSGRRQLGTIIIGTLPAAVIGFLAEKWIGQYFIPQAVAVGWTLTAFLLWMTPGPSVGNRSLEQMTYKEALGIGMFQALALWPGLSRSGTTVFIGRHFGFAPDDAARFSFLLAIPTVLGASILSLPALVHAPSIPLSYLVMGIGIATVSGLVAIQWVQRALKGTASWRLFGLYTFGAAIATWWVGG